MRKLQLTKNGRSSKTCLRGNWTKWRARKASFWKHKKRKRKSILPHCHIEGHLSSQECGVRTKAPNIQRTSRAPRRRCARRLRCIRCICSIYGRRIVCFANDGCKSDGRHCETSWLCTTSRRRSICLHTRKVEDAPRLLNNPKSECPDMWTQVANILLNYWRPSGSSWTKVVRTSTCWPLVGKTIWGGSVGTGIGKKDPNWECLFVHRKEGLFSSVYVDDIKMAGRKQNMAPMWKKLMKLVDLGEPHRFLTRTLLTNTGKCSNHEFSAAATEKLPGWEKPHAKTVAWSHDVEGRAQKCVERYCELANKETEQLYKLSTPCLDDHNFKKEELETVGEVSHVSSQIVLMCLYLARIGRLDTLWSVNKVARAVTTWTRACDRRLARWISYIHHTIDCMQYCHVGNTAQHCRSGLFQDSDLDLEDSHSTSGWISGQRPSSVGDELSARMDALTFLESWVLSESHLSLEVEHLFPQVGCARSKLQCLTVPQNRRLSRWMLVCEWTVSLLLIYGMWW